MTAAVYLGGGLSWVNHHIHTRHSLEYMITELLRGVQQPPEEMTCLAVLGRGEIYALHRVGVFGGKSACAVVNDRRKAKTVVSKPSPLLW